MTSELASATDSRQQLLGYLESDYPTLPTGVLLAAVEQYRHIIELRGDGPATRAVVEIAVRYRLNSVLEAQAARVESLAAMGVDPISAEV